MTKKSMTPVEVLKSILKRKVEKNRKYSLRAFARDLNLSPGRLSVILSGKEEPGHRFIKKILTSAVWEEKEKALFTAALQEHMGFCEETVAPQINLYEFSSEDLDSIETHTILALLRTKNSTDDHAWIARRLNLTKTVVDLSIQALLKHNVIAHTKNRYIQKIEGLTYDEKGKNPKRIAERYQRYLQQAMPELLKLEKEHSLFGTLVVPLDKEDIPRVKKLLKTVFKKIETISNQSKRSEVYNLSVINQRMSR
ncbi:hypothetical protein CIK05_10515 [Bdellovibrio sp. qaytius]|nr:hypothetical protein CIK05_10515 [Bdellovibrio sp. qaytius]